MSEGILGPRVILGACMWCGGDVRKAEANGVVYLDHGGDVGLVREGVVHRRVCADRLASQYQVKRERVVDVVEGA